MPKQKVLFLCTGSSARSQMAEAFVRKYAGESFEAQSAGLEPKGLNPLTIKVMNEFGIDISNQTSKGIGTNLRKMLLRYLMTVCDDADQNCPRIKWSVPSHSLSTRWIDQRTKLPLIRCVKMLNVTCRSDTEKTPNA